MIIHILGKPGSGKTTLGKRLSKLPNTIVFDTDDIDDPNAIKLLSKFDFKTKKNNDSYWKNLSKLDQKDIMEIIDKNKDKNIIFTGFLFGMNINVDKKFYIKISEEQLYRQFNLRTLESIKKNYKNIEKRLKSKNNNIIKMERYACIESKIRGPFMAPEFVWKGFYGNPEQEAKDKEYTYESSDKIFKDIKKILLKKEIKSKKQKGGNGNKITINNNNSIIEMIDTPTKLEPIMENLIRLNQVCEPDNSSSFVPILNQGDIFWVLKNKDTDEIIGFVKTSDLEQFKTNNNFEKLGGVLDKKGLQLIGVCNGIPERYKNVATPILNKIDEHGRENGYEYILLHAGTDRNYLHENRPGKQPGLYIKNGYLKIKKLNAREGGVYNIDVWIMRKDL